MLANADLADATISPEPLPKKAGGVAGRLALPADYPELRLFAMLLWKFGRPNGPLSLFGRRRDGDPDAPFKWDFLFVPSGDLKLQVIRGGGGIELIWWGQPAAGSDILGYLEGNLARYGKQIDEAIEGLEKYTLILNPYVRHKNIATLALNELTQINLKEPALPTGQQPQGTADEWAKQQTAYMALAERQASLMLLLVTESAFMAESYLNLLIAILVRKEIRASATIVDETLRRKWKAKIERLHVDCIGIPNPANPGDARMGAAKKMFDIRNRVAHSYPDKEDMALGKMWFHKSFPVLEKGEPFSKFVVALSNQLPSLEEARFCKKAADDLVEFLTELLDNQIREEIRFVSTCNPLGYNETKEIYGVPFGKTVALSVSYRPG